MNWDGIVFVETSKPVLIEFGFPTRIISWYGSGNIKVFKHPSGDNGERPLFVRVNGLPPVHPVAHPSGQQLKSAEELIGIGRRPRKGQQKQGEQDITPPKVSYVF